MMLISDIVFVGLLETAFIIGLCKDTIDFQRGFQHAFLLPLSFEFHEIQKPVAVSIEKNTMVRQNFIGDLRIALESYLSKITTKSL